MSEHIEMAITELMERRNTIDQAIEMLRSLNGGNVESGGAAIVPRLRRRGGK
jgi:hypothetical protein